MLEVQNFETSEVFDSPSGDRLETVRLGGVIVSKVTLQPGWSWEENLKPLAGTETCEIPHRQIILQGRILVRMDDGTEAEAGPGDVIVASPGHKAWVLGDEPMIAYDFGLAGGPNIVELADAARKNPDAGS
jgi:hypothetical protein